MTSDNEGQGRGGKAFAAPQDNLRRPRRRPPDLDPAQATAVIAVISRMTGKVDWVAVVAAVRSEMGVTYTRQSLGGHVSIRAAYKNRKKGGLAKPGVRSRSSGMQAALDRNKVLEAERDAARRQVAALLEVNQRYIVNAQNYGMPLARLIVPLAPAGRS